MKIKDLKEPYKSLALENQELQGNERNDEIKLISLASDKGFDWGKTPEGECFWADVNEGEEPEVSIENDINTPKHYNNEEGSLYKIARQRGWNAYQFDIIKRIDRCEKKGEFEKDLDKTIDVIKMYKEGI